MTALEKAVRSGSVDTPCDCSGAELQDMLPGILPQMGQENIGNLRRMAQESGYGAPGGGMGAIGGGGMGGLAGAGAGAGMGAHVVDDDDDDDGAWPWAGTYGWVFPRDVRHGRLCGQPAGAPT